MKNVSLRNNLTNFFDFTAIRLFISILAIFLSLTLPTSGAVSENARTIQPSVLDKLLIDFKSQKYDDSCRSRSVGSSSDNISVKDLFEPRGLQCPPKGTKMKPNKS